MPQLALFEGINASGQYGLWATNGTAANTLELTGIAGASANGLSPTDMTVFNSEVLFNGMDTSGQNGLWVTDGSAAGTYELSGITAANSNGIVPYNLTVFNGEVLFEGTDTNGQYGLWVTDGTTAGSHELTGIAGANTVEGLWPSDMTVFNGEVLFNGYDLNGQNGLWVTDGTAAGTHELTGITGANSNGLAPSNLTVFNGEVLFNGVDASGQNGLWVTDGAAAGTHELTGIIGASANGLSPSGLTVFNGEVLFNGVDASGQYSLWVTDGTAAGTHELSGISTVNSNGVSPSDITSVTLPSGNNAINDSITELYIGYYNRAPDPAGETYWVGRLQSEMSLSQIAQSYSVQTESTNLYPFLANPNTASTAAVEAFLVAVYANLFNRAPDTPGEAYWVSQLQTGASTLGGAIINIISGAQGNDLLTINNKVTVGDYFDTQIFNNNVQFSGTVAMAALSAVTFSASSVATAEAIVDTYAKTGPLASAAASQADVSLVGISPSHESGIAG